MTINAAGTATQNALYRFYNDSGQLLYVGITNHLLRRLRQHSVGKPWHLQVAHVKVEHHPTREAALAAEKAAILSERPRFNIQHNRKLSPQRTSQPRLWWEESGMAGWQSFTEMPGGMSPGPNTFEGMFVIPVVRNESQDRQLYREFVDAKRDAFYIRNTSGPGTGWTSSSRWEVLWDAYTIGDHEPWGDLESRLMNRLVKNLLLQGRITQSFRFPVSYGALSGFRALEEACVAYLIMGECRFGNVSSAVRAIEVLEGRPDPVSLGYHPEYGYPQELAHEGVDRPLIVR